MEFCDTPDQPEMAGVSAAVDSVRTTVTHLIKLGDDGGLNDFDTAGLVGLLRDFQGVLNLLSVFDQALIQHCVEQRVPEELCFRSMRAVMMSSLRVSPGEAGRRVKAAGWFADRHSMLGETLEPARPLVAAAQRSGELNSEQARVIADAIKQVDGKGFDPADVATGEQILIEAARHTGPVDLKLLGQRVVEAIDPDGTLPDDQGQNAKRFFRMRQSAKDGSWSGEFRLTNLVGQKLRAVIDSLIRPTVTNCNVRPATTTATSSSTSDRRDRAGADQAKGADGGSAAGDPAASSQAAGGPGDVTESAGGGHKYTSDDNTSFGAGGTASAGCGAAAGFDDPGSNMNPQDGADIDPRDRTGPDTADGSDSQAGDQDARFLVEPDIRTFEQRQHDAVELVLDRILRGTSLPDSGGTPATIIVTIDEQNLVSGRGAGRFADGSLVSAETVCDLTSEAEIVRVYKTQAGAILNLGRTRRLASRSQTLALIARDGGCSFPNCSIQPEWCERHHIVEWQADGPTNLDNLTLVCRYHHRYFQQRGWKCEISADRLPVWTPPKWQDPDQGPILHPRIQTINWKPNQR